MHIVGLQLPQSGVERDEGASNRGHRQYYYFNRQYDVNC